MFTFPLILSRMWGEVVISVHLYFMQHFSARSKPLSFLAEVDAEQHTHRDL